MPDEHSESRSTSENPSDPSGGSSATPTQLGRHAASGFLWILVNTAATKLLQIVAIAVMGTMLTQEDFGLFSIALSISAFIATFRDSGVRDLLVSRPKEYNQLVGPCFWLSTTTNFALGFILGITGEIADAVLFAQGKLANKGDLSKLVWIMAAALPLGSPSSTMVARLKVDLRFKALSWQMTIASLVRYGGQITLALLGWGPLSYVLPLLAISIVDSLFLYYLTREKAWTHRPMIKSWPEIWRSTQWIIYASVAAGITSQGFSAVAAPFLPQATSIHITGVVFFALSLLFTVESLIGNNLVQVMLPILSRMSDDPKRLGTATLRVLALTTLVAAPATIFTALLFAPVEQLVWNGKWTESAVALFILAPGFVLRNVVISVPAPLMQATGRFRSYFLIWLFTAIAALCGSALGGIFFANSEGLALCIAIFVFASCAFVTVHFLRPLNIPTILILDSILRGLLIAVAAGCVAWFINHELVTPHLPQSFFFTPDNEKPLHAMIILGRSVHFGPLIQIAMLTASFCLAFITLVRVLASDQLRDAISVLPNRLADPARRVLRL
ncbi:MAG: oligosaccharide flippase family protein [Phycisphaerales bacterium]|nr:oligosaccharide flippase family protein [Phycisphaerales bacterium]